MLKDIESRNAAAVKTGCARGTLSLSRGSPRGEGAVSIPSPPEGERDRMRGSVDVEHTFTNDAR